MSALPNSNASTNGRLKLTVDGHMVLISDLDAAEVARRLDGEIDRIDNQRLLSKLRLGVMLRQVRDQKARGTWEPWLKVTGIDPRRARAAVQLAEGLSGRDSAVDLDKWVERGLITQEESEQYRHSGAGFPVGVSLRQAEVAVGIRKAAPVAPVEKPEDLGDSRDETPCAGPEEIAALNRMYGIEEEEDGVDVTVTVDAQGVGTVVAAAALADIPHKGPPVARDQAVAGRIGPAELGRARRPEAAGQMNLLSVWMELESEVAGAAERGHGEKARAIVARHMAEIRKELAELGEAPVGGA